MPPQSTVKLVCGAHPETPVPALAKTQSWNHRLGIVLDSFVPGRDEMYFDAPLFLSFLAALGQGMMPDEVRITIELQRGEKLLLRSLRELEEFYAATPEENRDLPEEILWLQNSRLIGGGFPERWYAVGGPDIYHDSFTLSVFTGKPIFSLLKTEAVGFCGTRLTGVYETGVLI